MLSPHHGSEPYIFISYAHKDMPMVVPILRKMQESGFRIWYDEGIQGGVEWPEYIATKLFDCHCVLAFISRSSVNSKHCRREINFAIDKDKPLLVIYLDDGEIPLGMQLQLNTLQALYCLTADAVDNLVQKLTATELLQLTKGKPEKAPVQPQPVAVCFEPVEAVVPQVPVIPIAQPEPIILAPEEPSGWKCICGKVHTSAEQKCSCGNWRCTCGRIHMSYVSSCICGKESTRAERRYGNSWRCICGRVHMSYVSACVCGKRK